MHQAQKSKTSLICGSGAISECIHFLEYSNPVLDLGCCRSVACVRSSFRLSSSTNVQLELEPLYCEPLFHILGPYCAENILLFALCKLLISKDVKLPFYIFHGNGPALLGNSILHNLTSSRQEDSLTIPPNVGTLSTKKNLFQPTHKVKGCSLQTYSCLTVVLKSFGSDVVVFQKIGTRRSRSQKAGQIQ